MLITFFHISFIQTMINLQIKQTLALKLIKKTLDLLGDQTATYVHFRAAHAYFILFMLF